MTRAKPWRCETPPGPKQAAGSSGVTLAGGTRVPGPSWHRPAALPAAQLVPAGSGSIAQPAPGLPDRPTAGSFPSGCGGLGLWLTPGPWGHQRAPACGSCMGLTLSRGLNPPSLAGAQGPAGPGQAARGGRTAGGDGPKSSPREQPRGQARSPLRWAHSAAVIY